MPLNIYSIIPLSCSFHYEQDTIPNHSKTNSTCPHRCIAQTFHSEFLSKIPDTTSCLFDISWGFDLTSERLVGCYWKYGHHWISKSLIELSVKTILSVSEHTVEPLSPWCSRPIILCKNNTYNIYKTLVFVLNFLSGLHQGEAMVVYVVNQCCTDFWGQNFSSSSLFRFYQLFKSFFLLLHLHLSLILLVLYLLHLFFKPLSYSFFFQLLLFCLNSPTAFYSIPENCVFKLARVLPHLVDLIVHCVH